MTKLTFNHSADKTLEAILVDGVPLLTDSKMAVSSEHHSLIKETFGDQGASVTDLSENINKLDLTSIEKARFALSCGFILAQINIMLFIHSSRLLLTTPHQSMSKTIEATYETQQQEAPNEESNYLNSCISLGMFIFVRQLSKSERLAKIAGAIKEGSLNNADASVIKSLMVIMENAGVGPLSIKNEFDIKG